VEATVGAVKIMLHNGKKLLPVVVSEKLKAEGVWYVYECILSSCS
jgi:hypothetical protein